MSDRARLGTGREPAADHAAGGSWSGSRSSTGEGRADAPTGSWPSGAAAGSGESGAGELATPLPDRGHRALAIGGIASAGTAGRGPELGAAGYSGAVAGDGAAPADPSPGASSEADVQAGDLTSDTTAEDGSAPQEGSGRDRRTRRAQLRTLMVGDYPALRGVVSNWYLLLTLIVRLPSVILPLTVLTYVTAVSGQELWGAACAGAVHLGQAVSVLALVRGDRIRRRQWILLLHTLLHVGVICWLVFRFSEQAQDAPTAPWPWLLCLLAGLSAPQLGNATRLRWRTILEQRRSLDLILPSMRHDAVMDAVSLVLGALIVGVLAITLGPLLGIMAAAGLLVLCTTALLLHPTADILGEDAQNHLVDPTHQPLNSAMRRRLRTQRRMRFLPVVGVGCIGLMLGSIQMCLVYFTASVEAIETIGAQFAALGLTAGAAAVITAGARPRRPWNLWVLFGAVTVLATLLMSLPSRPLGMVLILAVLGAAIGPTLVAVFSTVPLITPLSEVRGLTAATSVLIQVGMGLGVGLAGVMGDLAGYETAALLPVLAAAALLATAFVLMARRSRVPLDLVGERPIPGTESVPRMLSED